MRGGWLVSAWAAVLLAGSRSRVITHGGGLGTSMNQAGRGYGAFVYAACRGHAF
jgi:hypothetical protein